MEETNEPNDAAHRETNASQLIALTSAQHHVDDGDDPELNRDTLEMVFRAALLREAGKRAAGMSIKRFFVSLGQRYELVLTVSLGSW